MPPARYLKLVLIRHAESQGNRLGVMEGQSSTALTQLGVQQAQRLRTVLRSAPLPTLCQTSPALRALQTAAVLCAPRPGTHWPDPKDSDPKDSDPRAREPSVPLQTVPALQEIHPGIFQGLTWAAAEAQYPDLCQQLYTQLTLVPIPQAESALAARQRAQAWLAACLAQYGAGDTVWVVSHGGLLLHLVAVILGCDRTWQIQIPNTALFEFWLSDPSDLTVDALNPEHWKIKKFNQIP
ncbi:MAG: histidine phosphatase family protein [Cyanobacteria bacterium J06632_22]